MATKQPSTIQVSKQLRDDMMFYIKDIISYNLQAIEKFLSISSYEQICAAIYTYTVEEFGKLVLLQQSKQLHNGQYEITYKKGFMNHIKKFELAEDKLPVQCIEISSGSFSRNDFVRDGYTTPTPADWETRKLIFHADFDGTFKRS